MAAAIHYTYTVSLWAKHIHSFHCRFFVGVPIGLPSRIFGHVFSFLFMLISVSLRIIFSALNRTFGRLSICMTSYYLGKQRSWEPAVCSWHVSGDSGQVSNKTRQNQLLTRSLPAANHMIEPSYSSSLDRQFVNSHTCKQTADNHSLPSNQSRRSVWTFVLQSDASKMIIFHIGACPSRIRAGLNKIPISLIRHIFMHSSSRLFTLTSLTVHDPYSFTRSLQPET